MHPDVLTIQRAVEVLGLSENHVRRLLRDGTMPGTQIGRSWRLWGPAVREVMRIAPATTQAQDVPEFVSLAQLADLLGLSEYGLGKIALAGGLPGAKLGRTWRIHWPTLVERMSSTSPRRDASPLTDE